MAEQRAQHEATEKPLHDVEVDPSLEQRHYHLLSQERLEQLEDAEALFERGFRMRVGIQREVDEKQGWKLILCAARLGHAVALAYCMDFEKGTLQDLPRAIELTIESANRGHPVGMFAYTFALGDLVFNAILRKMFCFLIIRSTEQPRMVLSERTWFRSQHETILTMVQ